jgi:AAHS family 4-hydroxybenzoate transporter-like MFS transporter
MSGELRSPVEEALENQPFGALQLRVVLLCALMQAFDGFDLGTIGMAAPSLSKAWGVAPPLFTTAFVMSSVGILVGALLSGPLGDRFGRKPLLIISVAFIAVFSVLSALAWSIPSITVMRFLTGLGIGGAMPVTVALTSDYSPSHRRGTLIMLMFCGNTLGGFLGGQLVAQILPIFGWQSIFLAGGIPPLLLIPILMAFLPESPRFLIAHRAEAPATQDILRQLNVSAQAAATKLVDVVQGNPVQQLFTGGLAISTILVWIVFFANLLNMYLFSYWMPTVLTLSGLKPETAVFYASMFSLGGILSTALLGPMIDRFGAPRVLACSFAFGRGLHPRGRSLQSAGAFHHDSHSRRWCGDDRKPARRQRHGRGVVSGADPLDRRRLGARDRAARRHCRSGAGWRVAGVRPAAEADLPVRVRSGADRRPRHDPADRKSRQTSRRDGAGGAARNGMMANRPKWACEAIRTRPFPESPSCSIKKSVHCPAHS